VGLFAAKSSWLMGAGRVIVIDHLDYRLKRPAPSPTPRTYNLAEYDDIVVEMKKATELPGRRCRD
jgi:threonine dehydrogenase-like Zn-dependent dehydrogenase